jgi:hypothetical protein
MTHIYIHTHSLDDRMVKGAGGAGVKGAVVPGVAAAAEKKGAAGNA